MQVAAACSTPLAEQALDKSKESHVRMAHGGVAAIVLVVTFWPPAGWTLLHTA